MKIYNTKPRPEWVIHYSCDFCLNSGITRHKGDRRKFTCPNCGYPEPRAYMMVLAEGYLP